MTNPHILRRKSIYHNTKLKKQQPSSLKLAKWNKFLYINHQLFKSHRTFLCHICLYLQDKTNEFDKEPLRSRELCQKSAFSQCLNRGGKINPDFFPEECITYNIPRFEPPTPEQNIEEEFIPFVTESFY